MSQLRADADRLARHIRRLAGYTATPTQGCTRLTYSEEDRRAREYILSEMRSIGLEVRIDAVGNIRARLPGRNPDLPPVITGSHLDSVFQGGNYDGVVGVVCALEALRVLRDGDYTPERGIELVVFVEEEGPNFGAPLAGSKCLTGVYTAETLKALRNAEGISMYEAARAFGLNPEEQHRHVVRPGDLAGMIELHIEQGVVLDSSELSLGIVTGIAGMYWITVRIGGVANHAGATPMGYRKDPLPAAAEVILAIEATAQTRAESGRTVATVGRIQVFPNAPNCIPEAVEFTVDIRDIDSAGIDTVRRAVGESLENVCGRRGLTWEISERKVADPVVSDPRIVDALRESAAEQGYQSLEMMSGALHDAAVMAGVTGAAMLFVPSIGGRSHVPQEATDIQDIEIGCNVLIGGLRRLTGV